jgi:hypothetical protein
MLQFPLEFLLQRHFPSFVHRPNVQTYFPPRKTHFFSREQCRPKLTCVLTLEGVKTLPSKLSNAPYHLCLMGWVMGYMAMKEELQASTRTVLLIMPCWLPSTWFAI